MLNNPIMKRVLTLAFCLLAVSASLHPLVTINSWNEWTETSYLQPDNVYGYGYLEAVKKVFMDGE